MSKSKGQKITVQFTEDITSVVNTNAQARVEYKKGITVSGTSTGSLANLLDNNLTNTWGHYSVSNFIQTDMQNDISDIKRFLHGFKVHIGASSRPTSYTISISDNGSTYTPIKNDTIPQSAGWHEFILDTPVKTRYARVNFGYSGSFVINEFALLVGSKIGGFTVSGQEYKYVDGPILDKEYVIEDISNHPVLDKAILIEFNEFGRFPTVEGSLTVNYDATVGTLAGRGGNVESFNHIFTPDDIVPEPNPNEQETLTVAPAELVLNFIPIEYVSRYAEETLTVAPAELTVTLIYVGVVNP